MRDNRLARGAGRDIVGASWWSLSSMMGWCGSLSSWPLSLSTQIGSAQNCAAKHALCLSLLLLRRIAGRIN